MLLQTLPMLAMIFVIGFGVIASQLVAVRYSVHHAASRDAGLAVDAAVIDVTRNIAQYVHDNGSTEGPWKSPTEPSPKESTCAGQVTSQVCLYTTYQWRFTGASRNVPSGFGGAGSQQPAATQSQAVNLQRSLIDEQRVSVQIIAAISTAKGDHLGDRTRDVTFRVFNAAPYAVAVGSYDVSSELGSAKATQGDTGGDKQPGISFGNRTPDPQKPDEFRDTTIQVTLACQNSVKNKSQDPYVDNNAAYVGPNASNLPWGVTAHAYETPCIQPKYQLETPPAGAPPYPPSSDYTLSEASNLPETWNNGETTSAAWAH